MGDVKRLLESFTDEITCCICLEVFKDPVSIECGHNFCHGCIAEHWDNHNGQDCKCPECRKPCQRNKMPTDFRIKRLVDKINQALQAGGRPAHVRRDLTQPHGEAVQLVGLDKDGGMVVYEEAIKTCLQGAGVDKYPACMISIIGGQSKGAAGLLNHTLRKLRSMERRGNFCSTQPEWKANQHGAKGVWMWRTPFLIDVLGEKVAVFLVDTEFSLDIDANKESSVKLSALSMLLSSYLIFTVSTGMRETDLEYLEMFIHASEELEDALALQPIKHLSIVVHDCSFCPVYGHEGGQQFQLETIQKIEKAHKYPRTLKALRSKSRCCMLPSRTHKAAGIRQDTEDAARIFDGLAEAALHYVKMDNRGVKVTFGQFAKKLKKFVDVMKKNYGFSSPLEIAITMKNQDVKEEFRELYSDYLREQDMKSSSLMKVLQTKPIEIKEELSRRLLELLEACAHRLVGDDALRQHVLNELLAEIEEDIEQVTGKYNQKRQKTMLTGLAAGVAAMVAAPVLSLSAVPLSVAAVVGGFTSLFAGSRMRAAARTKTFDRKKNWNQPEGSGQNGNV